MTTTSMVKGKKRRTAQKKVKQNAAPKSQPCKSPLDQRDEAAVKDAKINDYFPKVSKNSSYVDPPLQPEVAHVPSPDDAALPNNSILNGHVLPPSPQSGEEPPQTAYDDIKCAVLETSKSDTARVMTAGNNNCDPPKGTKKKEKNEVESRQLTDYFPVRRSERKPRSTLYKERQKLVEDKIIEGTEDGYEVKEYNEKGRGVITKNAIRRGEFVLEYSGELIDVTEAKQREVVYAKDENIGCYMYYFTFKGKQYCVDATQESGRLGRLVNHSKKGNLKTRAFVVKGVPHLVLVAQRDIQPGEELLYDYGDRSRISLEYHPWLAS